MCLGHGHYSWLYGQLTFQRICVFIKISTRIALKSVTKVAWPLLRDRGNFGRARAPMNDRRARHPSIVYT